MASSKYIDKWVIRNVNFNMDRTESIHLSFFRMEIVNFKISCRSLRLCVGYLLLLFGKLGTYFNGNNLHKSLS